MLSCKERWWLQLKRNPAGGAAMAAPPLL